jgi:hypothetical protein
VAGSCLAIAVAIGCAGAPSQVLAPQSPEPNSASDTRPARRPDAVVLEPPTALPTPVSRADARGVVSLRQPLAGDAVVDLVQSFVDAWQRESLDALAAMLASDAGPIDGRIRGRGALVEAWRQRLHAHEYARLANSEVVRPERIARWDRDDLGAPDAPAPPPDMRPGEIYVRAPLEVTRVAGERLFGDVMVMVLRAEDGKLKIAAYGEVDAP